MVEEKKPNSFSYATLAIVAVGVSILIGFLIAAFQDVYDRGTTIKTGGVFTVLFVLYLRSLSKKQTPLTDKDIVDHVGKNGFTKLMSASAVGDIGMVRKHLTDGADKDAADDNGYTALMFAAANGHESVVKFLLEIGANRSLTTGKGSTAKQLAERRGHMQVVQLFN